MWPHNGIRRSEGLLSAFRPEKTLWPGGRRKKFVRRGLTSTGMSGQQCCNWVECDGVVSTAFVHVTTCEGACGHCQ